MGWACAMGRLRVLMLQIGTDFFFNFPVPVSSDILNPDATQERATTITSITAAI